LQLQANIAVGQTPFIPLSI